MRTSSPLGGVFVCYEVSTRAWCSPGGTTQALIVYYSRITYIHPY